MPDSLPPSSVLPPQTPLDAAASTSATTTQEGKQVVEIVKLPSRPETTSSERQQPAQTRHEGRVSQSNPDTGRVTIRTDQGDIDVQFPKDSPLPPRSTPVEIRLPPAPTTGQNAVVIEQPSLPPRMPADQISLNTPQKVQTQNYPDLPTAKLTPPPTPLRIGQDILLRPFSATQLPPLLNNTAPPATPTILQPAVTSPTVFPALPIPTVENLSVPVLTARTSVLPASSTNNLWEPLPPAPASYSLAPPSLQQAQLIPLSDHVPALPALPVGQIPKTGHGILTTPALLAPSITTLPSQPFSVTPQSLTPPADIQIASPTQGQPLPPSLPAQTDIIHNKSVFPTDIPAKVIATTPKGHPVILIKGLSPQITPQLFTINNVTADIGTELLLPAAQVPSPITTQSSVKTTSLLPQVPAQLLSPLPWPALEDLAEFSQQQAAPPSLTAALTQLIPNARTPSQIPPAILLFFIAAKGGDLSGWLGDKTTDSLKRLGKSDLLSRLTSDFSTLSRATGDNATPDWKSFLFPFAGDQHVQNIVVFYKHQDDPAAPEDGKKKQTRFIFDMDLSRMGTVQIDGLFIPQQSIPRLDIVLRTEAPLSEAMRHTLRQHYAQALKAVEIAGDLSFQGQQGSFVTIIERTPHMEMTT